MDFQCQNNSAIVVKKDDPLDETFQLGLRRKMAVYCHGNPRLLLRRGNSVGNFPKRLFPSLRLSHSSRRSPSSCVYFVFTNHRNVIPCHACNGEWWGLWWCGERQGDKFAFDCSLNQIPWRVDKKCPVISKSNM